MKAPKPEERERREISFSSGPISRFTESLGVGTLVIMYALAQILTLVLVAFCTSLLAGTDGAKLSAGAARAEITPSTNLLNWTTGKPYPGVLDPLYVRALVLSDGMTRVALLGWDLVDTREGMVAKIRSAIETATGIPRDHILINASHSHSGPFSPTAGDPLIAIDRKVIDPVEHGTGHKEWADTLLASCIKAVRNADAAKRPASVAIGRAWAGEVLFNRRPVREDGKVETTFQPANPYTLPHGQRFGPVDPTLTVVSFRDEDGKCVATLFHLPCHSVAIYSADPRISFDWPGAVCERLRSTLGGEAIFLQGCAGDIVPARRGLAERDAMAQLVSERALAAVTNSLVLVPGPLKITRSPVTLELTPSARHDFGSASITSEVQTIACGSLAITAMPGEPLTGIGQEILRRSPFPHTLVLGYSNGNGVEYVGLPGEKSRGGYEMGESGEGADGCGQILIETALVQLKELGGLTRPAGAKAGQ